MTTVAIVVGTWCVSSLALTGALLVIQCVAYVARRLRARGG